MRSHDCEATGCVSSGKNQQAATDASRMNGTLFSSLIAPGEDFLGGHARRALAHLLDFSHRPQRVLATTTGVRVQVGISLGVARNLNRFATFDVIEQLCELRFGSRCLNLLHENLT